uniref:Putative secreted peptide n=1 Tax=Anopheles braziliensis TaxID=58242 RepID=A0A2M3ZQT5_9DIPT
MFLYSLLGFLLFTHLLHKTHTHTRDTLWMYFKKNKGFGKGKRGKNHLKIWSPGDRRWGQSAVEKEKP